MSGLQRVVTRCPACGSADIAAVDLRESYFVRNLAARITVEFAVCKCCAFTFQVNPLSEPALERYYEDNAQLRTTELNLVEEFVHSRQAAFIESAIPLKGRRVLEIGSSTGKFLDFLRQIHGADTYFDEKNAESRAHLARDGGHKSFDQEPRRSVDVLVLRHVLEHVPEPLEWLKRLRESLDPAGFMFIEVPDWSFVDDATNLIAFEHVSHFTQHTLSLLLHRAGLIIVKQEMSITPGYATSGGDRVLRSLATPAPAQLAHGAGKALKEHHFRRVGRVLTLVEKLVRDAARAGEKVAFYGASWGTERVLLNTSLSAKEISCIFDRDSRKQGSPYYDLPVYDPSSITEISPDVVFIFTSHAASVKRDLIRLGFSGRLLSRSDLELIAQDEGVN